VKRRINELAQNVKDILLERLRRSEYFALQLDESHNISNNANLVAFVRYEHENKICEDFSFHESLPLHTIVEALFKVVNDFITTNKLQGEKCIGTAQMVLRQCREYIKVWSHVSRKSHLLLNGHTVA
jgi:hypothetical protein